MTTVEVNVYKFSELSDTAKEKAREWFREGNLDYNWWEFNYENFKEVALEAGFNVTKIYFSGFWSQGDGAMFEYDCIEDKLFTKFVGNLNLSPMRRSWLTTQAIVSSSGKHRGHYYHSKCCEHSTYIESNVSWAAIPYLSEWIESFQGQWENFIQEEYEDLCSILYKGLEEEYDYLNSDEVVDESIEANEYDFDEDGDRFRY